MFFKVGIGFATIFELNIADSLGMSDEKGIKRYEPYGFLLVTGLLALLGVMLYALFKFRQNLRAGVISAPAPGPLVYTGLAVLVLTFIFLALASRFFRHQQFPAFRACLAASFGGGVLFVVLQVMSLPVQRAAADPVQQGYYFLAFLSAVHLLFALAGVVATGVWVAQVYRRQEYVESFIFSMNPPNILNMKLLLRYMGFVTVLWAAVIFFIGGYAA